MNEHKDERCNSNQVVVGFMMAYVCMYLFTVIDVIMLCYRNNKEENCGV